MRHRLSNAQVRAAKPRESVYRLTDGQGLYLLVKPTGRGYWRYDYRLAGRRLCLALGTYPEVSLAEARREHEAAEALVRAGTDPVAHRRETKATRALTQTETLAAVAEDWIGRQDWTEGHRRTVQQRLALNVLPWLGARPVTEIHPGEVERCLVRVADRGALETAHRVATIVRQVYRSAAVRRLHELAGVDARRMDDLHDSLPPLPPKRKRAKFPAIVEPRRFGALLRAIEGFEGTLIVGTALRLSPLLMLRPGELRALRWNEVDLEHRVIEIPGERMKLGEPHMVPLARQSIELFGTLRALTGAGGYVFPSVRSNPSAPLARQRPMSENTINATLRRVGVSPAEHVAHGFRASARTMLTERLGFREPIVEKQLAHLVRDPNHGAYDRTSWLDQRVAMMQRWADFCDELRESRESIVVPFRTSA